MSKIIKTALNYLLARAAEKSTWAGIVAILVAQFGCELTGVQVDALAQLGVQAVAAILVLIPSDVLTKLIKGVSK